MGKAKSKSPAKSSTKRSSSSKVSNASKARPAKSAAAEDSLAARLLYGDDQPQMFALVNPRTNAIERAARREEIEAEL